MRECYERGGEREKKRAHQFQHIQSEVAMDEEV